MSGTVADEWAPAIVAEWEQAIPEAVTVGDVDALIRAARSMGELNLVLSDGQRLESRLALRRRQVSRHATDDPGLPAPDPTLIGRALTQAASDLQTSTRRRIDAIRDARAAGWSYPAIGNVLGVTEAAVRGLVRRNK